MVQAVRLRLPRCLAHILAVSKQAVEVELVGVFAIGGQTRITGGRAAGYRLDVTCTLGQKKDTSITKDTIIKGWKMNSVVFLIKLVVKTSVPTTSRETSNQNHIVENNNS